jgi:hypothetical protein
MRALGIRRVFALGRAQTMSSLAEDSEKPQRPCETAARIESTSDSGRDDTRRTARVDHLCKVLGIQPHEFGAYLQSVLKREGILFVEDVWTGSGSAGWAELIPDEPKRLLLGTNADAVGIGVAVLREWLWFQKGLNLSSEDRQKLAANLAILPPDASLDKLLWHAPKKLSDILNDAVARKQNVSYVLNVQDRDAGILSTIAVLGDFDRNRSIPADVVNFEVAHKIWAAFLADRHRCVCVYGVSGGGKTMAMILASRAAAEYRLPSGRMYEPFVVYVPLRAGLNEDLDAFAKKWCDNLPIAAPGQQLDKVTTFRDTLVAERDTEALEIVKSLLKRLIPDEARIDFDANHEHFALIVLDDMGSQPYFVHALCSLHARGVCQTLADHLKVSEVRIVVGGTGCERSDFQPGSTDTTSTLIRATTLLWQDLTRKKPFLAPYANLMRGTLIPTRKADNIAKTHWQAGSESSTRNGALLSPSDACKSKLI